MHQPIDVNWQSTKRILRYLAAITTHGIYLSSNNVLLLHAFSDVDCASDSDDYVSTNAHIVYLGKTPVSWSSKKQARVVRSSK